MEKDQINWLNHWKHFDWRGLSKSQLNATKKAFKAMSLVFIQNHLDNMYERALLSYNKNKKTHKRPKKRKVTLTWDHETVKPLTFFLVAKVTPPPDIITPSKGGVPAVISPKAPPQP